MPANRDLWRKPFYHNQVPPWPCPLCLVGRLELRDGKSLTMMPSAHTRANMRDENFPPEHETGAVSCLVVCNRHDCGEVCAVAGCWYTKMRVVEGDESPVAVCWPQMIAPPSPMIRVPAKCPVDVREQINAAFRVFWCDKAASLNNVRQAIELLLTSMGVPRARVVKKGTGARKRERRSLHDRISWLRTKRPNLADMCDRLMAVKHLGNAGSHPGVQVEEKDVFDGLDILERILVELFEQADSELARMVKEINKLRGPRKTKA